MPWVHKNVIKNALASHYGCLNIDVETSSEKKSSNIANHLQSYNFDGLWDGEHWITFTIRTLSRAVLNYSFMAA